MPFTHVYVKQGTPVEKKKSIAEGVHQALVESILMPQDDFFQMVSEYSESDFFFDRHFLGIDRSDDLVVIQTTLRRGRSDAMKKALYAGIAANHESKAGIRPQDVFIYLSENDFSDWSVGNGQMSMSLALQKGSPE